MKKLRGIQILQRGENFLSCWKELASEDTEFCGTRYPDLKSAVEAAKAAREKVRSAELLLSGLRFERDRAERTLADKLIQVACGVRGTPGFGDDCGFYRALGFIPHSQKRSGRPRKPKTLLKSDQDAQASK